MIAIVDYGMGNLCSVEKAFLNMGYRARVVDRAEDLAEAQGLVLPGVGAFAQAMANLRQKDLVEPILSSIKADKPFLGICLGFHLLFGESEEWGRHRGLGVFPGRVVCFNLPYGYKVPHVGWNQVEIVKHCPLWEGIPDSSSFYFVHSYYVLPDDGDLTTGRTDYGINFTSAAARGNVFGIQFHPEKSSRLGLKLLNNFGKLVEA